MSYKKTQFGTIPNHWEVKSLADIGIIKGRIGWRGYTVDDIKESGPYVLGAGDITTDNKVDLSKAKHLSVEKYEESPEIMLEKGDTLIVKVGSTIGKVGFFNFDNTQATINPNSVLFRTITAHPAFVYYYLCTRFANNFLISNSPASAQPAINQSTIKQMPVIVPPLNEQKAIANILSSLDDKIELNNKINKNLEELAQTLYKHWFVDFEFPNEEGLPYKSSGGKMIESEQGLIPEGWEVKNLNSLVKQYRIKSNPNENEKLIDLANMPGYSLTLDSYDYGDKLKTNIYEMKKNNILYGSIRPYLGKFGIAPFDGLTTGTIHQFLPINNSEYSAVSTLVFSKEFNDFCIKLSYGTKMPVINWKQLGTYKVIYNNDLFEKFNEITKSYYENIVKNINENIKLRNIRDLLLPKLMSGEIRVPIKE